MTDHCHVEAAHARSVGCYTSAGRIPRQVVLNILDEAGTSMVAKLTAENASVLGAALLQAAGRSVDEDA